MVEATTISTSSHQKQERWIDKLPQGVRESIASSACNGITDSTALNLANASPVQRREALTAHEYEFSIVMQLEQDNWIERLGEDVEQLSLSFSYFLLAFSENRVFFRMFSAPKLRVVEIEDYPEYILAVTGLVTASLRTVIVTVMGDGPESLLIAALPNIKAEELHLMLAYPGIKRDLNFRTCGMFSKKTMY